MHQMVGFGLVATLALTMTPGLAQAADNCSSARVKAIGKYEACVQKWTAKCVGPTDTCDAAKLWACTSKLSAAWTKIARLQEPPCDGNRWIDNMDGTTTDQLTGLIWERKSDDGGVHDKDNVYTFTATTAPYGNGTVFTQFLPALNAGAGLGGANDWRLPTLAEATTFFNAQAPCDPSPCSDALFGSDVPGGWWTATRSTSDGTSFIVYGDASTAGTFNRSNSGVIAVRGGIF